MGSRDCLPGWGPGIAVAFQPGRAVMDNKMVRELSPMGQQDQSVKQMRPQEAVKPLIAAALRSKRTQKE